jgi:Ca2+-binding RTX toxin-like protein
LLGGAGNDTLEGGSGADRIDGGAGDDLVSYANATAAIVLNLRAASANTGDAAGDSFSGIERYLGTAFSDQLAGSDLAEILNGGLGDDSLWGHAGNDNLIGDAGNDWLQGGLGADTLSGQAGFDTVSYASAALGILVDLATSSLNKGEAAGDVFSLIEAIEGTGFGDDLRGDDQGNRLGGGAGNDSLTGRLGNDQLFGGAGNDNLSGDAGDDTLTGGGGGDVLNGGAGFDWASYSDAGGAVSVDMATPRLNKADAMGDTFALIEGLFGSGFNDDLRGTTAGDALDGGAGHDFLAGRAGSDSLYGGLGDDTLDAGSGADQIFGGEGTDVLSYASSRIKLTIDLANPTASTGDAVGDRFTGIERILAGNFGDILSGAESNDWFDGGAGNDRLTGRGGDDTLLGGAGNDVILGGSGADSMDGGLGIDLLSYAAATGAVGLDMLTATLGVGDGLGDQVKSIETITGSGFNDSLAGDDLANRLFGGVGNDLLSGRGGADTLQGDNGNDTLVGGAGADSLNGGMGTDFASYADAGAGLSISLVAKAVNTGDALGDVYLGIEGLIGSRFDDTLLGSTLADLLFGGAGNDILGGNGGADSLDGGEGFDWASYAMATKAVQIDMETPSANKGDALGDRFVSIEGLRGSALGDLLSGDSATNHLDGGAGNDSLNGRDGADLLSGGAGNDALDGGKGNDQLFGGAGNDSLRGGWGADDLWGGTGADRFYHAGALGEGMKRVHDFTPPQGDLLMFTGTGAAPGHFVVSYVNQPGIGLGNIAEAIVTHVPSGQILWTITDGDALNDLMLQIGTSSYDLI